MTSTLTLEDLVDRLGHSRDFWLKRCQRKEIPHLRIGRDIRFTEEDVEQIISDARVTPRDPLASVVRRSRKAS